MDAAERSLLKGHRGAVVWLTGLSGAGKSSIADRLEQLLHQAGVHTYLLDGDALRRRLTHDLGCSREDRAENVRRVSEVARLMVDAGLITIVALISPFADERRRARERFGVGEFIEVFVDAPLEIAESRDPKGLYRKARAGELKDFTGIDSPYEPPSAPELRLETARISMDAAADAELCHLRAS